MGLFKEQLFELDAISKSMVRIFNDSCDVGIRINEVTDPVCLQIKEILNILPKSIQTRKEVMINNLKQVYVEIKYAFDVGNVLVLNIAFNQVRHEGKIVKFIYVGK